MARIINCRGRHTPAQRKGSKMSKEMIWGVVRAVLAAGGGYVVGTGVVDNATMNDIIGALGVIFAAGWSIWAKK